MKRNFGGLWCIVLFFSLTIISWKPANSLAATTRTNGTNKPLAARALFDKYIQNVYESARLADSGLEFGVFKKALTGFVNLKASGKLPQANAILTVIDFSISSMEKRMWIIDVANKTLLLHTWVAHGEMSGDDIPTRFSDKMDSRQSSLGFYLTDEVYIGEHGRALKLDGLDAGFNENARKRAIVLHGAGYVCQSVIDIHHRLGRSYGCPAVSTDVIEEVVDALKDKSVIFISANSERYHSKYLDEDLAANYIAADGSSAYTASL
jgi:hypothetical protein